MHELLVKWIDKSQMVRTVENTQQLGKYIRLMRGGVVFAQITTPSGVTKDITELFNQQKLGTCNKTKNGSHYNTIYNTNNINTTTMRNEKETTTYKHRNCIITTTPSEKHPEMVTVTKTPAVRKEFEGRRYLTLKHAYTAIETYESERLIKSKENYVKKQLAEVVVVDSEFFFKKLLN